MTYPSSFLDFKKKKKKGGKKVFEGYSFLRASHYDKWVDGNYMQWARAKDKDYAFCQNLPAALYLRNLSSAEKSTSEKL